MQSPKAFPSPKRMESWEKKCVQKMVEATGIADEVK